MAFAPPGNDPPPVGDGRREELSIIAAAVWNNPDRCAYVRGTLDGVELQLFDVLLLVNKNQDAGKLQEFAKFELDKSKARELAAEMLATEKARDTRRTWTVVGHDEAFAARERPMPTIGRMIGCGYVPPYPILYRGKINDVHGDSEGGKSWFAQHLCVQEMNAGKNVLYIDFEDDAGSVYGRLEKLGADEQTIRRHFQYIRPENSLNELEKPAYLSTIENATGHTLAVVDGVTEATTLEGLTGRDENDVAKWHAIVTKPLAAAGWGVLVIDHTPLGESRVIGSQHKKSSITGVSYELDSIAQFIPGQAGRSRLKVAKDRLGWIRQHAQPGGTPQWYGDFTMDETVTALGSRPAIWAWKSQGDQKAEFTENPPESICRAVLAFVEANPGVGARIIREAVKGKDESINWAIKWLVDRAHLSAQRVGHTIEHHYESPMTGTEGVPEGVPQGVPEGVPDPREHLKTPFEQGELGAES